MLKLSVARTPQLVWTCYVRLHIAITLWCENSKLPDAVIIYSVLTWVGLDSWSSIRTLWMTQFTHVMSKRNNSDNNVCWPHYFTNWLNLKILTTRSQFSNYNSSWSLMLFSLVYWNCRFVLFEIFKLLSKSCSMLFGFI